MEIWILVAISSLHINDIYIKPDFSAGAIYFVDLINPICKFKCIWTIYINNSRKNYNWKIEICFFTNFFFHFFTIKHTFFESDDTEITKNLPREILLRIFSFLDVISLCRCAQVTYTHFCIFIIRIQLITDLKMVLMDLIWFDDI